MLTLDQYLLTVRQEMKKKKIKQKNIAKELKLSEQTISNVLNGANFSPFTLDCIISYIKNYKGDEINEKMD